MIQINKYQVSPTQYLESYRKMLLIRRFEEKCGQLYGMGFIGGFCHLYIGQEAVITGIELIKQLGDSMITSYRDHAHTIAAGIQAKHVMAELMGKATGCSKGKGGSMHMFSVSGKFYGGHGIVGAQVSLGTGLAFAERYYNSGKICFTFLGDGAINQGQVYESFNMAALWKLPVVYIIENNEYSMGTSVKRSTSVTDLYTKGQSFGIPGFQLDGMDLQAVYDYTRQAAEFVRGGGGPIILEMKTYRYRGHSLSDPAKYRTKEEVDEYKTQDPLGRAKNLLLTSGHSSEADLAVIEKEVRAIVQAAVEFAESSPLPDEAELYTDVYNLMGQ